MDTYLGLAKGLSICFLKKPVVCIAGSAHSPLPGFRGVEGAAGKESVARQAS